MNVTRATQVRNNFQEVIDKVHYTKESMIISKHGKPWVIIQPLKEGDKTINNLIKKNSK